MTAPTPDREQEIRVRAEAATPDLDALTPHQCPAGKHADWAVDSDLAHNCPWCEIDHLREEAHLFTVAMAQRDAYAAAAARRALEDAADDLPGAGLYYLNPNAVRTVRRWLRDRAAVVASPAREQGGAFPGRRRAKNGRHIHATRLVDENGTGRQYGACGKRADAAASEPHDAAVTCPSCLAAVASLAREGEAHCPAEYGGPGYTHCELPHGHTGKHESAMGNLRRTTWGEEAAR